LKSTANYRNTFQRFFALYLQNVVAFIFVKMIVYSSIFHGIFANKID